MRRSCLTITLLAVLVLAGIESQPAPVNAAQTAAELQQGIDDTNARIAELQAEIDKYASLLDANSKQAKTLQTELSRLETTRKKLESDLKLTTNKISKANLTLEQLSDSIAETEIKIAHSGNAVAQGIRNMEIAEGQSMVQQFLSGENLSDVWNYLSSVRSVQASLSNSLTELTDLKEELVTKQDSSRKERLNLLSLQKNLSGQKEVVEYNKTEQAKLLADTQNSASAYQSQLAQKIAQKEQFERDLFQYESQLKLTIDPNSIPDKKSGVLSWPLDDIVITQRFGKTSDSGRLYTTGTHNGVDFRASVGTPVKAVLSGVVWATGNTDLERGCYSYGKWVLIKHPNGLSTIYGHLSSIGVQPGDTITTGEQIGFSGNTGYTTGPHLHLGLFATQGVRVQQYTSSNYCKNTTIPIADVKAYLDPLAYLPEN